MFFWSRKTEEQVLLLIFFFFLPESRCADGEQVSRGLALGAPWPGRGPFALSIGAPAPILSPQCGRSLLLDGVPLACPSLASRRRALHVPQASVGRHPLLGPFRTGASLCLRPVLLRSSPPFSIFSAQEGSFFSNPAAVRNGP